ncbi:MAG: carbohydrate kinase [Candidatus Acidiferrum sp.]
MSTYPSLSNPAAGNFTVVGLGELLWDMFPQGPQLGGAPANFAYISSLLGDHGIVASRLGNDVLGEEARRRFQHLRLPTDFLQTDDTHPTGTVRVSLDAGGQPKYEIAGPVAWDFFEMTSEWKRLSLQASAISYGTLAQRTAVSRDTILEFLDGAPRETVRVFDVNLRQSFYNRETLRQSAGRATVIKLNDEELPTILELLDAPGTISATRDARSAMSWMLQKTGARLICVTCGGRGSLLASPTEYHEHPGLRVKIKDTVGAGDAFAAALVHHFLRSVPLAAMNEAANTMGAWVASCSGAMPEPDLAVLEKVRNAAA